MCAYVGFSLKNRTKRSRKILGKQQWIEHLRQPYCHFSPVTYMEGSKSWNCCVVCERKWFSRSKRLYRWLRVLSYDCLGDQWRWCYLWKMQEVCRKAQTYWMVYFYLVVHLKLPLIIWSTHFPVSVMYSFNCSASAMYLQFLTKNIVQRSLYSVSKVFFLYMNHNRRADYENKKALTVINSKTKRTKRNENL